MKNLTPKILDKLFEDFAIKYGFNTPELTEIRTIMGKLNIDSEKRAQKLAQIIFEENLIKLPSDEIITLVKDRL